MSNLRFYLTFGTVVLVVPAVSLLTAKYIDGRGPRPTSFYVSTRGNDANPCTQESPCRTIQGALDKVPPPSARVLHIQLAPGTYAAEALEIPDHSKDVRSIHITGPATLLGASSRTEAPPPAPR